jgi:hypothetical protein
MRASQFVLDELRARGAAESTDLDYTDNWGRYRRIAPLTEDELRTHVAADGRFPDEHALGLLGLLDPPADQAPPGPSPSTAGDVRRTPHTPAPAPAHAAHPNSEEA